MPPRIVIVDYGMGNLASVERALRHVAPGAEVQRIVGPEGLKGADAAVLPGVGAFDAAMRELRERHLEGALRDWLAAGRPLLGICLGFQLLFEGSEEVSLQQAAGGCGSGAVAGLGWFSGRVRRFEPPLTVPHMGWNALHLTGVPCPLFDGVPDGSYVYFAHSYYPESARGPAGEAVAAALTRAESPGGGVGVEFVAAAWRQAAGGVQFHPEKSGRVGLTILGNFVRHAVGDRALAAPARAAGGV